MSTCVVITSNERCENRENIKDIDSVFPLAVAMKLACGITFDPILVSNHISISKQSRPRCEVPIKAPLHYNELTRRYLNELQKYEQSRILRHSLKILTNVIIEA